MRATAFFPRDRYLPKVDHKYCSKEDKQRQTALGLDNIALPFSMLAGATVTRFLRLPQPIQCPC